MKNKLNMEKVIEIKSTRVGARRMAIPIDSTINVVEKWGKGTHGEAVISGYGRYFLIDVSSRGNHYCKLVERSKDGSERVVESVEGVKYCRLCKKYLGW